jgi:hypothetical protein
MDNKLLVIGVLDEAPSLLNHVASNINSKPNRSMSRRQKLFMPDAPAG